MKMKGASSRLTRWALSLQYYNFEVQYRNVSGNGNADAMPRLPNKDISDTPVCSVIAMNSNPTFTRQQQK